MSEDDNDGDDEDNGVVVSRAVEPVSPAATPPHEPLCVEMLSPVLSHHGSLENLDDIRYEAISDEEKER